VSSGSSALFCDKKGLRPQKLHQLEGTHIVQIHAVLLLTVTLTLTFQPKIVPLVGYPKVILYTKFEHFGIIFYAPTISVKNALIDPVTFTFLPFNPKSMSLLVYPKVIPYTKFEYFGSFIF